MKNTVTFETAQKLEEAGFPQPTPEAGQFWYRSDCRLFCVHLVDETTCYFLGVGNSNFVLNFPLANIQDFYVFAPTATDILREFESQFRGDLNLSYNKKTGLFTANEMTETVRGASGQRGILEENKNPHEATALSWLNAKEGEK